MKISIAMATYNGAQYLQEQLDSFKNQTQFPDELIITDDCSTDETEAIVLKFAKNAPFKVVFSRNSQNLGYCGNFNAALMKTSGDLVFLSDQDDVWFPEKIEYMVTLAENNSKALVLMNDASITDGVLNERGITKIAQIESIGLDVSNLTMGCCCCIRRELINICLPIPLGFKAHDDWISTFANALHAKLVDRKVLQYYRRHEANESKFIGNRTTKVTRLHVYLDALKNLRNQDNSEKIQIKIEQMKILSDGVNNAINDASPCWKKDLEELNLKLQKHICIDKQRDNIRSKKIPNRIFLAMNAFRRGIYSSHGVRSMLRDIAG